MDAPVNKMEASNTCLERGLSLPGSEISQKKIKQYMSHFQVKTSWLGIKTKHWPKNHYKWLDGTEFGKSLL